MKNPIVNMSVAAFALSLFAGSVEKAEAQMFLPPSLATASVMYDPNGFPIWGITADGRFIYAYSPDGLPIYAIGGIFGGCYVPTWDPRAGYHGPRWPRGIHRGHFPKAPRHVGPPPPGPRHGHPGMGPGHGGRPGDLWGPGRPGRPGRPGMGPGHGGGRPGGPGRR